MPHSSANVMSTIFLQSTDIQFCLIFNSAHPVTILKLDVNMNNSPTLIDANFTSLYRRIIIVREKPMACNNLTF